MKTTALILLLIAITSCTPQKCTDSNGHKWGKWQDTGRHNMDGHSWYERQCETCGWTQGKPIETP